MKTKTAGRALGLAAVLVALVAALVLAATASAAGNETLTLQPSSTTQHAGDIFTVTVQANADVATTGSEFTFNFDYHRYDIEDVTLGPDWAGSQFIVGVAPNNTKPLAIADANATGILKNVTGYYSPPTTVPAGTRVFAVITMKALANDGTSAISLSSVSAIDSTGSALTVSAGSPVTLINNSPISVGGFVDQIVTPSSSGGISLLAILLIAAAALIGTGGLGYGARRAVRRDRIN